MAKGNNKAYLNSPLYDNTEVDIQENANMISCIIDSFNAPIPDLHDKEQCTKAINDYFNRCIKRGLRPGNLGLYNALGLNKNEVHDIINGRYKNKASADVIQLLKKAVKNMSEYREMLGSTGKLNPATLIFWQKNYDGLEDIQRIDIDANNAPKADMTADEIQQKLLEDMPVDSDYKEVK